MTATNKALAAQIMEQLRANKNLAPSQAWLATFLSSQRAGLPTNTLVRTASFRLLNSDIKTSLDANAASTFPPDAVNATTKERRLSGDFIVQVLDVDDMSRSHWSQIEELEAEERGEMTKGREIIRITPGESDDHESSAETAPRSTSGPHKLLVEDIRGTKIYAIELNSVHGVGPGMGIGSKLVLKDPILARGVIMLDTGPKVICLGGKIEPLHTQWRKGRKEQLKATLEPAGAGVLNE